MFCACLHLTKLFPVIPVPVASRWLMPKQPNVEGAKKRRSRLRYSGLHWWRAHFTQIDLGKWSEDQKIIIWGRSIKTYRDFKDFYMPPSDRHPKKRVSSAALFIPSSQPVSSGLRSFFKGSRWCFLAALGGFEMKRMELICLWHLKFADVSSKTFSPHHESWVFQLKRSSVISSYIEMCGTVCWLLTEAARN